MSTSITNACRLLTQALHSASAAASASVCRMLSLSVAQVMRWHLISRSLTAHGVTSALGHRST